MPQDVTSSRGDVEQSPEDRTCPTVRSAFVVADQDPSVSSDRLDEMQVVRAADLAQHDVTDGGATSVTGNFGGNGEGTEVFRVATLGT